jgi:hypothetical protein
MVIVPASLTGTVRTRTWITLSAGPPCPGSLNHATPSSTRLKYSLYSPAMSGARSVKVKRPVAPGATVRSMAAGRLGASQSGPCTGLARSRGCVVPRRVRAGVHVAVPVLRISR